jgi:serine/threonine protein phosphatase PrpC
LPKIGSDGAKAALAAKTNILRELQMRQADLKQAPLDTLKKIFMETNQAMLEDQAWDPYLSGTTAVVAILVNNLLHVANVGDSRLVVVQQVDNRYEALELTKLN